MSDALFLGATRDGDRYLLDPERLRTHALVVGMTGSGKTGMALVMLEELVRAGVPVLAIDPKGDLGNLGLLFPTLDGPSFAPWADGQDPDALATRWRDGLARWGLDAGSVRDLADRMDLTLYTPGSESGVAVDVVTALARPPAAALHDEEARLALVDDTVSGLLGLVGHRGEGPRDPAHVVLATLIDAAWQAGDDLDLSTLVLQLVDPPFEKVGVFPLDRFFPPDDRMDLAMRFNAVLASPGFAPWTRGVPLDLDAMLAPAERTPVHIFSLSHLDEAERAFFLSLLLGQVLAWSRRQPGTERLRAALFFDEVSGWIPPHPKDPPSKRPLMTLMKQARAVGLGVVLATQNPVDVDYKAISNAGLWVIGRLRTPQDRQRLLAGLPGEGLDEAVEGLGKREFLVARADGHHEVVASRHAMCFLRGPFTRTEVRRFTDAHPPGGRAVPAPAATTPAAEAPVSDGLLAVPPTMDGLHTLFLDPQVAFSPRFDDVFASQAEPARADGVPVLRPALYARFSLRFDEERQGFVMDTTHHRVLYPLGGPGASSVHPLTLHPDDLLPAPPESARFAPLPDAVDEADEVERIRKTLLDDVVRTETEGMWVHRKLALYGRPGESEEAFAARVHAAIQERIDDDLDSLRDRFQRKADALQDRIERAQERLADQQARASAQQTEELVGLGETVFSLFSGRRRSLTSVASRRRRTSAAQARVDRTESEIERLEQDAADLALALDREVAEVRAKHEGLLGDVERRTVHLERADVQLELWAWLWVPATRRL